MLLAPTQRAYAQICALITQRDDGVRRKASTSCRALDFDSGLSECLALWIAADATRGLRCRVAARAVSGPLLDCRRAASTARTMHSVSLRLQRDWAAHGLAAGCSRRRAHAREGAARTAGYGDRDSPSLHARARPAIDCFRTANAICARIEELARSIRAICSRRRCASPIGASSR